MNMSPDPDKMEPMSDLWEIYETEHDVNHARVSSIISEINKNVSNSKIEIGQLRRLLPVMKSLITSSEDDVINNNIKIWMDFCINRMDNCHDEKIKLLDLLVQKSANLADNASVRSHITINILPKFISHMLEFDGFSKSIRLILKCLKVLLSCYIGSFAKYKIKLSSYTLYNLKYNFHDPEIVHLASWCYCALFFTGLKDEQGVIWANQFNNLILTADFIIDQMFTNVNVERTYLSSLPDGNIIEELCEKEYWNVPKARERYKKLHSLLSTVFLLLEKMILIPHSTVIKSFDRNILDICEILLTSTKSLKKGAQNADKEALMAVLPEIFKATFQLLAGVIKGVKHDLVPFGSAVCKLCMEGFGWFRETNFVNTTLNHRQRSILYHLRAGIYETLLLWLRIAGPLSGVEIVVDDLICQILSDIKRDTPVVTLTNNVAAVKNTRKRKSSARFATRMESATKREKSNLSENKECCKVAHMVLQNVMMSVAGDIKVDSHKKLHTVLVSLLLDITRTSIIEEYPVPYADTECRLQLYKSLLYLITDNHPKVTPPLSYAFTIFNAGLRDDCPEIIECCRICLSTLKLITHPRGPTLNISSSVAVESVGFEQQSIETPANVPNSSVESDVLSYSEKSDVLGIEPPKTNRSFVDLCNRAKRNYVISRNKKDKSVDTASTSDHRMDTEDTSIRLFTDAVLDAFKKHLQISPLDISPTNLNQATTTEHNQQRQSGFCSVQSPQFSLQTVESELSNENDSRTKHRDKSSNSSSDSSALTNEIIIDEIDNSNICENNPEIHQQDNNLEGTAQDNITENLRFEEHPENNGLNSKAGTDGSDDEGDSEVARKKLKLSNAEVCENQGETENVDPKQKTEKGDNVKEKVTNSVDIEKKELQNILDSFVCEYA